jgi:hypothetical protein
MADSDYFTGRVAMIQRQAGLVGKGKIALCGDSITELMTPWWSTLNNQGVINCGFSGACIADLESHLPLILPNVDPWNNCS